MYVSDRDIEVMQDLIGLCRNAIEGGAEDEEYWGNLSRDSWKLFDKMKKRRDNLSLNRKVNSVLRKLDKAD